MKAWRGVFALAFLSVFTIFFFVGAAHSAIDNSYQENNPTVLYDDNSGFWSSGGYGNGSVGVSTASSTAVVESGNQSLQVNLMEGNYAFFEVGHVFGSAQNWDMFSNLCFWFYGSNSGETVEVALAAPDSYNQFWVTFLDNFTGWSHFVQPLNSMNTFGNASLSNITQLGFFFFNGSATFYIDRVILDIASAVPTVSPSSSPSSSPTPTVTPFPTANQTPTPSPSFSPEPASAVPTVEPTPSATYTETPEPSATSTLTPSANSSPDSSQTILGLPVNTVVVVAAVGVVIAISAAILYWRKRTILAKPRAAGAPPHGGGGASSGNTPLPSGGSLANVPAGANVIALTTVQWISFQNSASTGSRKSPSNEMIMVGFR